MSVLLIPKEFDELIGFQNCFAMLILGPFVILTGGLRVMLIARHMENCPLKFVLVLSLALPSG